MRLNIYHTNDIHTNFAFLGRVCAYLEEHRAESDLYLDSGDFLDLKSLVVQADRGRKCPGTGEILPYGRHGPGQQRD